MNARLPNGETRLEVAKRAVKGVAALIPAQAQIGLRMYGAQSPSARKDCQDTHLAVPFAAAGAAAAPIAASVDAARAQGYTPIAHALAQAVADFPADARERVVVLVSDGKETCQGDPVVAARALAQKRITVHTVGFVVDTAARGQLQAVAAATGGSYFDAPVGPELPERLKAALNACAKTVVVLPKKPQPGRLRLTDAGLRHPVFNAETGEKAGEINRARLEVPLPAGICEVQFGPGRRKGIEVKAGQLTTIAPATLRLEYGVGRVVVRDTETGDDFGNMDAANAEVVVMLGVYDLVFNKELTWRFVKLDGGKKTVLAPPRVSIDSAVKWERRARLLAAEDGREVWRFDNVNRRAAVPPGDYVVAIDKRKIPFAAREGDHLEVKAE